MRCNAVDYYRVSPLIRQLINLDQRAEPKGCQGDGDSHRWTLSEGKLTPQKPQNLGFIA